MDAEKKEKRTPRLVSEPVEMELSEIVENEEDKKILEPVKNTVSSIVIGYVIADRAFVRSEPNNNSDILCILKKNETLAVDSSSIGQDYYMVTVKSIIGYVAKTQITIK